MLKRNLLFFFRNIKKDKTSFLINLIGLSTGLACAILIYLWVNDELNVDKFHEKDSQLYQVMRNYQMRDDIKTQDLTPVLLAKTAAEEIPEVECATSISTFLSWRNRIGILSVDDNHLKSKGIFATGDYFDVFPDNLLQGDKDHILKNKDEIIISEGLAKKLFKTTENIIGKTLEWKHSVFNGAFQVTGIFKNPPRNATEQFDLIFNMDVLLKTDPYSNKWSGTYANTYLILTDGANIAKVNNKLTEIIRSKPTWDETTTLFIQQYSKKYLYGNYENGVLTGGRIMYVRLFSIIALFILVIACINFMNLSTARASKRTKEVGIKKATGVSRKTLVAQFLGESMLMAFLSLMVAILFVVLLLPQFNELTGKHLHLNFGVNIILSILGIVLFTGLISGSYPAFYLSKFDPATVLKGKLKTLIGEQWVRKGLVVFQFSLSVVFIVGFLVINKQIEFTHTKNLGYNRDNVICFSWNGSRNNYQAFMSEIKNISSVVSVSSVYKSILDIPTNGGFSWEGSHKKDYEQVFPYLRGDYNLIETLGIGVKEGRLFSMDYGDEKSKIILNEAAVKMTGYKDPIGKSIKYGKEELQIIGVVKDFHYGSFYNNVKPAFIGFSPNRSNIITKIKTGTKKTTIELIKHTYKKLNPNYPFEFTFLDDDYQALYESENKVAILSKYFSAIAIIISCLGLFGLAAFTVERRRKEIGIRKVHGSSGFGIMKLVSSDFSKIVLISITISLPISYFIMKNWLDGFAYRIALSWWFFAVAGLIALLVAWLTVGSQALKASSINPAICLKDE